MHQRPEIRKISSSTLFNLKIKHDLAEPVVDSIAGYLGVGSNSSKKIKERSHSLEEFYVTEKVEFTKKVKVGNKVNFQAVEKDLVYVNNISSLIFHICEQRSLDPLKSMVRVGIDGGGGSLKMIMNIFEPDNLNF